MQPPEIVTPTDPMQFTKDRLGEIAQVWVEFAKLQADTYKEKLPEPLKQYVMPKPQPESSEPGSE